MRLLVILLASTKRRTSARTFRCVFVNCQMFVKLVSIELSTEVTSPSPGTSYQRQLPYRYIYIYILEVGGAVQPGNRFVSFVRASGRGEAKLRGRARGDSILVLGLFWGKRSPTAPPKPCPGVVREFFDV